MAKNLFGNMYLDSVKAKVAARPPPRVEKDIKVSFSPLQTSKKNLNLATLLPSGRIVRSQTGGGGFTSQDSILPPPPPPPPSGQQIPLWLGCEIPAPFVYNGTRPFINIFKTGNGCNGAGGVNPLRGVGGWPIVDFYHQLFTGISADDVGTYTVEFDTVNPSARITEVGTLGITVNFLGWSNGVHRSSFTITAGMIGLNALLILQWNRNGGQADYRNIAVLKPGYTSRATAPLFDPRFLAEVQRFDFYRFMNWLFTVHSSAASSFQRDWINGNQLPIQSSYGRAHPNDPCFNEPYGGDSYTVSQTYPYANAFYYPLGVPWEHCIALCNTNMKHMWINIPINASDDYVKQLALLIDSTLNASLAILIGYTNETWNPGFQAGQYMSVDGVLQVVQNTPFGQLLNTDGVFRTRPINSTLTLQFSGSTGVMTIRKYGGGTGSLPFTGPITPNQGLRIGDTIAVQGATDEWNNIVRTITNISGDGKLLTLTPFDFFFNSNPKNLLPAQRGITLRDEISQPLACTLYALDGTAPGSPDFTSRYTALKLKWFADIFRQNCGPTRTIYPIYETRGFTTAIGLAGPVEGLNVLNSFFAPKRAKDFISAGSGAPYYGIFMTFERMAPIGSIVRVGSTVTATIGPHTFSANTITRLDYNGTADPNFPAGRKLITAVTATTIQWTEAGAATSNAAEAYINAGVDNILTDQEFTAVAGQVTRAGTTVSVALSAATYPSGHTFLVGQIITQETTDNTFIAGDYVITAVPDNLHFSFTQGSGVATSVVPISFGLTEQTILAACKSSFEWDVLDPNYQDEIAMFYGEGCAYTNYETGMDYSNPAGVNLANKRLSQLDSTGPLNTAQQIKRFLDIHYQNGIRAASWFTGGVSTADPSIFAVSSWFGLKESYSSALDSASAKPIGLDNEKSQLNGLGGGLLTLGSVIPTEIDVKAFPALRVGLNPDPLYTGYNFPYVGNVTAPYALNYPLNIVFQNTGPAGAFNFRLSCSHTQANKRLIVVVNGNRIGGGAAFLTVPTGPDIGRFINPFDGLLYPFTDFQDIVFSAFLNQGLNGMRIQPMDTGIIFNSVAIGSPVNRTPYIAMPQPYNLGAVTLPGADYVWALPNNPLFFVSHAGAVAPYGRDTLTAQSANPAIVPNGNIILTRDSTDARLWGMRINRGGAAVGSCRVYWTATNQDSGLTNKFFTTVTVS